MRRGTTLILTAAICVLTEEQVRLMIRSELKSILDERDRKPEDVLLNVTQVCKMLGVSRTTLSTYDIPKFPTGTRSVRYKKSDVEIFMRGGKHE